MTKKTHDASADLPTANTAALLDNLSAAARTGRLVSLDQRTTDDGTITLTIVLRPEPLDPD